MLLPPDIQVPSGFETVGDIAHLNLDESQMPYRYDIGEVMLRKTHGLRTVITKVGFIKNVFRTFDYELLAGVDNLETT